MVAGVAAYDPVSTDVAVNSRACQIKGAAIFGGYGDNTATQRTTVRAIASRTQKGTGVTAIRDRGRTDFAALDCSGPACAASVERGGAIGLEFSQSSAGAVSLDPCCCGCQSEHNNQ